ncbi:hypothetical protein LAZ67_1000040 [Cordylochernes scorpioides]|uniref:Uncharacterized protein n=1 Tax=Cordylochernes scorpioides TaxID=51811 RepID=A0ABY6JZ08_9ARAC|nr:hypothetical protein LAZ67_1000040 [Cordylochernes scorpioides]
MDESSSPFLSPLNHIRVSRTKWHFSKPSNTLREEEKRCFCQGLNLGPSVLGRYCNMDDKGKIPE